MSKIGYIRVSTIEQETARQEELLQGYKLDKVFMEKASGKNTDRPELRKMLDYLREDDILYVESISRLSRSIRDLLSIVDTLNEKKVQLVVVKENIDTTTPQGRFVLSIFAALSELEREQILQRQREGIAIAKAQGKYAGKQFKHIDEEIFERSYKKWKTDEITARRFAKLVGLTTNSLYRRIKRFESYQKIN